MQTKLIQTKDYLLLIDEEAEIKEGDYIYVPDSYSTFSDNYSPEKICIKGKETWILRIKKIIAYYPLTKEAKELDLPELPPFEKDNIVNEVEKIFNEDDINHELYNEKEICNAYKAGIYDGYKAAQSKGQYSLEDMKKAINEGFQMARNSSYGDIPNDEYVKEFIQSLSTQQLPSEFIPEYELGYIHTENGFHIPVVLKEPRLKTITNSEGKQELVGTYKY